VANQINIQGHRGARGLYPENTVRGFIEAVKLGVHSLELDIVISADHQVVVSHEAWMNEDICSLPDGSPVKYGTGQNFNLFKMNYSEIKKFDCGKRGNPYFPLQKALPAYKPLLDEVITTVENFTKANNLLSVTYNIELKTEPEDGLFNPPPEVFVEIVYEVIRNHLTHSRIQISSFDVRLLKEMKKKDPAIKMRLLVENRDGLEFNLQSLGFVPEIYSPEFVLVDQNLVNEVHHRGMQLVTWTVNENYDMSMLLSMGVDGIITDYPDRLIEVLNQNTFK
jgi:glycerophosphoryl diester phosphodiesterase